MEEYEGNMMKYEGNMREYEEKNLNQSGASISLEPSGRLAHGITVFNSDQSQASTGNSDQSQASMRNSD